MISHIALAVLLSGAAPADHAAFAGSDPAAESLARSRAQALLNQAQAGHAQFQQAFASSLELLRKAGPAGSTSWSQAQAAVARADSARAQTKRAQDEIERLVHEVERNGPGSDAVHAVRDARRTIADLVSQQASRMQQLRSGRP